MPIMHFEKKACPGPTGHLVSVSHLSPCTNSAATMVGCAPQRVLGWAVKWPPVQWESVPASSPVGPVTPRATVSLWRVGVVLSGWWPRAPGVGPRLCDSLLVAGFPGAARAPPIPALGPVPPGSSLWVGLADAPGFPRSSQGALSPGTALCAQGRRWVCFPPAPPAAAHGQSGWALAWSWPCPGCAPPLLSCPCWHLCRVDVPES